jgi:hypothetical protein
METISKKRPYDIAFLNKDNKDLEELFIRK